MKFTFDRPNLLSSEQPNSHHHEMRHEESRTSMPWPVLSPIKDLDTEELEGYVTPSASVPHSCPSLCRRCLCHEVHIHHLGPSYSRWFAIISNLFTYSMLGAVPKCATKDLFFAENEQSMQVCSSLLSHIWGRSSPNLVVHGVVTPAARLFTNLASCFGPADDVDRGLLHARDGPREDRAYSHGGPPYVPVCGRQVLFYYRVIPAA